MVEIAKVLSRHARIIVMDEPSAALTDREVDRLFDIIATLKAKGAGIIYISHRLEELPRHSGSRHRASRRARDRNPKNKRLSAGRHRARDGRAPSGISLSRVAGGCERRARPAVRSRPRVSADGQRRFVRTAPRRDRRARRPRRRGAHGNRARDRRRRYSGVRRDSDRRPRSSRPRPARRHLRRHRLHHGRSQSARIGFGNDACAKT